MYWSLHSFLQFVPLHIYSHCTLYCLYRDWMVELNQTTDRIFIYQVIYLFLRLIENHDHADLQKSRKEEVRFVSRLFDKFVCYPLALQSIDSFLCSICSIHFVFWTARLLDGYRKRLCTFVPALISHRVVYSILGTH